MQEARLENWIRSGNFLIGNVFGHPKFNDGEAIATSLLREFHPEYGWALTENTKYFLGEKSEILNPLAGTIAVSDFEKDE